jgi:predicted PurR-regulated permease PerM
MNTARRYQNQFFFIVLGLGLLLAFFIIRPFINPLVTALAFAVVLLPIQRLFLRLLKKLPGLSAFFTILIAILIAATPITLVVNQLITETEGAYTAITFDSHTLPWLIERIQEPIRTFVPGFTIDLPSYVQPTLKLIASGVGNIFATTVVTLFQIFVFFVALFVILRNGRGLKQWVIETSPLPEEYTLHILQRVQAMMTSVLRGSLLIAMIQGTLAGIGFAVVGIPNPTLWGFATSLAALTPGIGTGLIMIPMVIYLFMTKQYVGGIELGAWAMCAVGLIDNVIGPGLMGLGKNVRVPPFLILLAVLGGIGFFGPLGFIIGPTVLSFILAMIDVYKEYILHEDEWEDAHEDSGREKRLRRKKTTH